MIDRVALNKAVSYLFSYDEFYCYNDEWLGKWKFFLKFKEVNYVIPLIRFDDTEFIIGNIQEAWPKNMSSDDLIVYFLAKVLAHYSSLENFGGVEGVCKFFFKPPVIDNCDSLKFCKIFDQVHFWQEANKDFTVSNHPVMDRFTHKDEKKVKTFLFADLIKNRLLDAKYS